MILRNTGTSAAVGGVTTTGPADAAAPVGFGVVADAQGWRSTSGPNYSISALGVLGATGNIDWSAASYFTFTTTSGTNLTLTFYTTDAVAASLTTPSYTLGQKITIRVTGAGTPSITWPATVTWLGTLTGTSGASQSAPVVINTKLLDIELICTGVGSSPTFDGRYRTGV